MKNLKICFAASTGGHYEQLMMLKPLMEKHQSFILTEKTSYVVENQDNAIYYLDQVSRNDSFWKFSLFLNILKSLYIFMKEKPDVIICTGVLSMIPMCLIGKIFHKKLIYIESFAKVKTATETGKLLYKYADRFYVQWESMLEIFPDAIFRGAIY